METGKKMFLKLFNIWKNSPPTEFFNLLVTSELLDMILEQTGIYATSQSINNRNAKEVDEIKTEDIQKVFGMIFYIGILKLPNRRMYWQNSTRVDIIANPKLPTHMELICQNRAAASL